MSEPLLSVCLITYNHINYIKEAIDGVLMQKVNFSWEFIIADDYSTDGTREILLEYKDNYPEIIRLILQDKNVGPAKNWDDLMNAPKSKYIAYFEGDDYWIDPLKLQKQIDFLEVNEDYSMCFHNSIIKYENIGYHPRFFNYLNESQDVNLQTLIESWIIPSASMVFKKDIFPLPEWASKIYSGDMTMTLIALSKGKIFYLNEIMSVYRQWNGNLSNNAKQNEIFIRNQWILLYSLYNEHTSLQNNKIITRRIKNIKKEIKYIKYNNTCFLLPFILLPQYMLKKIISKFNLFFNVYH